MNRSKNTYTVKCYIDDELVNTETTETKTKALYEAAMALKEEVITEVTINKNVAN